jgi:GntR family transcriptional regulator/MocR family aminotransferase
MNWNALASSEIWFDPGGAPRYEQLALKIANFIHDHHIAPGERLPTVREFSRLLNVSATTVSSAFEVLTAQRIIRAEVGRGTFVNLPLASHGPDPADPELVQFRARLRAPQPNYAWRRRSLMTISARLRSAYPNAMECSTGRPDPALLPLDIIRGAWNTAMHDVTARDLQYASPEPIPALREQLKKRLASDDIPVDDDMMLICDSAQQAFTLTMELLAERFPHALPTIAVEEPGYPTLLDTLERGGFLMTGMQMDEFGVLPASLEAALRAGAQAVFFTPRGQNPTGASWSTDRRSQLADVLAEHPRVLILEDDQVAEVANTRPGSLLADPRLKDRVLYVRSFSKAIAPDLRIALVVASPSLLEHMSEAKSFSDGWTSRIIQHALACIFADSELEGALRKSRVAYAERRRKASESANRLLVPAGGATWAGTDGVNIWIQLPQGRDSHEVIERAAASGLRIADGEPFYLAPGHRNVLRLNAGSVASVMAAQAGAILGNAAANSGTNLAPIHV